MLNLIYVILRQTNFCLPLKTVILSMTNPVHQGLIILL